MKLKLNKYKILFLTAFISGLLGCSQSPAEQCLHSFRGNLKDPNSGKIIGFSEGKLSYTATNSYGARIQSKVLCSENTAGEWERDAAKEELAVYAQMREKNKITIACLMIPKNKIEDCMSHSNAMIRANQLGRLATEDEMYEESSKELGFSQ